MTDSYSASLEGAAGDSSKASDLTDQAKEIGREIKAKASELSTTVTRAAKDQAEEITTAAKDMLGDSTVRVKAAMNDQKAASADYLGTVAQAVQRAAGEFENEVPQAAQYIRRAGGQLANVANAVRQRDMRDLVTEVEVLARREPALFFGGAVILGFAALRFLKSSTPNSTRGEVSGASGGFSQSRSY